jgi:hypothetical protein
MKHETYWLPITTPTIAVPRPSVSCTSRGTTGEHLAATRFQEDTVSMKLKVFPLAFRE